MEATTRRDCIKDLMDGENRVTDMAHVGDLDARCLVQGGEHRQDVDEIDELTDELVGSCGAQHGGRWLTLPGHVEPGRGGAKPGVNPRAVRDPSNGRVLGAPRKEARREDGRGGQTAGMAGERER